MHTWFFLYDEKVAHDDNDGNDDDNDDDRHHYNDDDCKFQASSFKGGSQARSRWSKTGEKKHEKSKIIFFCDKR